MSVSLGRQRSPREQGGNREVKECVVQGGSLTQAIGWTQVIR